MEIPAHDGKFTISHTAAAVGVSAQTLVRWEKTGLLPKARRVKSNGVEIRVYSAEQVEEIRKFVEERKQPRIVAYEDDGTPIYAAVRKITLQSNQRRKRRFRLPLPTDECWSGSLHEKRPTLKQACSDFYQAAFSMGATRLIAENARGDKYVVDVVEGGGER
ncbi:MAG: MerR family transcriptional regulator [Bryobacterales bacterium]|nr:MerR family transcriptional regulator [Bryobacterales bacterium]